MKRFLMNAFWSILLFFAIILAISYLDESYIGMKKTLTDPFNWIVIAVVILASFAIKIYRRKNSGIGRNTEDF